MPEIVGALFAVVTVIANAGSEVVALPSPTLIWMFEKVPAAVGVPCSAPVVLLNVAQAGAQTQGLQTGFGCHAAQPSQDRRPATAQSRQSESYTEEES